MSTDNPIPVCPAVEPHTLLWSESIKYEIAHCASRQGLSELINYVWHTRFAPDVRSAIVPALHQAAERIVPEAIGKKIVAVDLSGVFHSAFSTKEGTDESIELTLKMLRNIHKETAPNRMVICVDSKRNHRKDVFAGYKSTRPSKPRDFAKFLGAVVTHLKSKNVPVEEHDGFESDDIMASLALRAYILKQELILVTEDKDLWQSLIGKKVIIYSYNAKRREYRNAEWLKANHQIEPKQALDWICLVGKDDVPGAAHIGEKTASELLSKYQDFMEIWDHKDELTPAKQKGITEFWDGYWLARKIHQLNPTLHVDFI